MGRQRWQAVVAITVLFAGVVIIWLVQPTKREPGIPLVEVKLAAIAEAVAEYHRVFGKLPQTTSGSVDGTALVGGNSRQMEFIRWERDSLGPNGELLDPWSQPFRITLMADEGVVVVSSAGPNRVFGNEDDESHKRPLN